MPYDDDFIRNYSTKEPVSSALLATIPDAVLTNLTKTVHPGTSDNSWEENWMELVSNREIRKGCHQMQKSEVESNQLHPSRKN